MKLTDKNTGYILMNAQTQSEWDTCTHALLSFTPTDVEKWKKYAQTAKNLKEENPDFANLSFYESVDFLNLGDDILPEEVGWSFVELEEGENNWDQEELPEQRLDTHMMKVYSSGCIQFTAYGKHTSEEFWTTHLKVESL
jgi:hypothetical protein